MRKFLFLFLLLISGIVGCFPLSAFAAGSCTFTAAPDDPTRADSSVKLTWTCTAGSDGTVDSPTITGDGWDSAYSGLCRRARVYTGSVSSAGNVYLLPQDAYVTTLDRLGNLGTSISTTAGAYKEAMPLDPVNGAPIVTFREILLPYATGIGAGGVFQLELVLGK